MKSPAVVIFPPRVTIFSVAPETTLNPPVPLRVKSEPKIRSPPKVIVLSESLASIVTALPVVVKSSSKEIFPPRVTFFAEDTALIVRSPP